MPGYYLVPQARTDLREVLSYIAEDNVEAADRVLDRFLEVFELLGENPDMGHFREDLTTHPVRFFSCLLVLGDIHVRHQPRRGRPSAERGSRYWVDFELGRRCNNDQGCWAIYQALAPDNRVCHSPC